MDGVSKRAAATAAAICNGKLFLFKLAVPSLSYKILAKYTSCGGREARNSQVANIPL
jgi:hypothetical protein